MTPIGGTMADLKRAIDVARRIMDDAPRFANLRTGGNLPSKPYRWTDWHTAGLIVSGLFVMMFAILGGW